MVTGSSTHRSFFHRFCGLIMRCVLKLWDNSLVRICALPSITVDDITTNPVAVERTIEDDCNLPPTEFAKHDDFTPMARMVQSSNPKKILEFGTGHGNTTANLCALSEAQVYTVNASPADISGKIVTFSLSEKEIGRVYRRHGYSNRVTQIFANTLSFDHHEYFSDQLINLAIIDACHDTLFVLNDFFKVLPTLQDQAIVLFHDTHPSMDGHLAGSYRACVHLRICGLDIKHIDGTWWGYWKKQSGSVMQRWRLSMLQWLLPWLLRSSDGSRQIDQSAIDKG